LKGTPIPPAAADPSAAAAPMMKERPQMAEVRALADKSYQAGFLKDALKYYTQLVETDPNDYKSALRLAWTYNQLHQDREAFHLFNQARMAPDAQVAAEAQRAYDNLKPQFQTARASAWMLPFYSSRWKDAFAYGQFKTEVRVPQIPFLRPYVSMRMIGDARGSINKPGEVYPQYLSESAVIPGAGVATPVYRGLMAWAEAGYALSYLAKKDDRRGRPDYRGGVSFSRGFGQLLGGSNAGAFAENHEDGVFVSRFNNSLLFYTQNKVGYTLRALESFDDLRIQFYVNVNVTADAKRQYWANFVEYGPGIRLRWKSLPRGMTLSVDYPRGRYLITNNNPNPLSFTDLRAGFWYAFSR
jgi:tetratricopeptide (TPR) repeat protein